MYSVTKSDALQDFERCTRMLNVDLRELMLLRMSNKPLH